jgi:hypothetical protein
MIIGCYNIAIESPIQSRALRKLFLDNYADIEKNWGVGTVVVEQHSNVKK